MKIRQNWKISKTDKQYKIYFLDSKKSQIKPRVFNYKFAKAIILKTI